MKDKEKISRQKDTGNRYEEYSHPNDLSEHCRKEGAH